VAVNLGLGNSLPHDLGCAPVAEVSPTDKTAVPHFLLEAGNIGPHATTVLLAIVTT
jgi:hypothetical protein